MTFKDLEVALNRLVMDFEVQEKQFLDEVVELNARDLVVRDNQNKIFALGEDLKDLETEKDRYQHEVDVIEQQQNELESLVVDLEKALQLPDYTEGHTIGLKDTSYASNADMQRQSILQMQVAIDAQLKQVDDDVSELCDQLVELRSMNTTATQEPSEEDENATPLEQIRQVLRKQMDTLSWVDQQS
ncbi:Nsp1-like C-terminal region family protein, partial [Aphelenchoides avenae]